MPGEPSNHESGADPPTLPPQLQRQANIWKAVMLIGLLAGLPFAAVFFVVSSHERFPGIPLALLIGAMVVTALLTLPTARRLYEWHGRLVRRILIWKCPDCGGF